MVTGYLGPSPGLTVVSRCFVAVDGCAVHYRYCGDGPAVVMLHDSPRSSRLHLDTMRDLARRFRVYALDTPGYGNSDPLELDTPAIGDFAAALGRTIAALGLDDAPLYATHTSAKIALEYAATTGRRAPLILDGLSIPVGAPDPAFIGAYMRPFLPDASGGYIASEWTRMRDMLRWFPWFDHRPATRIAMAMPSDAWISDYIIDFFAAGASYSSAYSAAMYYDPMPALRTVACPTRIAARSDDVLYSHLDRVPVAANAALTVERLSSDRDAWLRWLEDAIAASAGDAPAPALPPQPEHGAVYADLAHGQMLVHRAGPASEAPRLLILSAPTTLHALRWQAALAHRATLVPELPGFGESDPLPTPTLDTMADALAAMLDTLDLARVDVLATGFATPIGAALAVRHPGRVGRVILDGCFQIADTQAPVLAQKLCPTFAFDPAGSHLHRYWHMVRDAETQWPWYVGDMDVQRTITAELGATDLHDALLGILKQPEHYGNAARAACIAAPADRYPRFAQPALLLHRADDPGYSGTEHVAASLPNARIAERLADIEASAGIVHDFLRNDIQDIAP